MFNLKDKSNPSLALSRTILPHDFAAMTSEEMASPARRQENMQIRRKSLMASVGIDDRRPVSVPDESILGQSGTDGTVGASGQLET